jgi:hypothetical protein
MKLLREEVHNETEMHLQYLSGEEMDCLSAAESKFFR